MTENSTAVRGRVLVCIYSADKSFISEVTKQFKEKIGITEILAEVPGAKVFSSRCLHTMEDEIYPLMKELYSTRSSDDILLAAVACFFNHNYTERVVLYGDNDVFEFAPIRKIEGAELEEAEKTAFRFRRKCMNRFHEAMEKKETKGKDKDSDSSDIKELVAKAKESRLNGSSNEASGLQTKEDFVNATFEQFSAYLFGRITFFINHTYEDYIKPGCYSFFWGKPNPEGKEYVMTEEGDVYYLEGIQPEKSLPLYPTFEQFLFWPKHFIRKFLEFSGWCVRVGDKVFTFTNPYETESEESSRAIRDAGFRICMEDYMPLLAGGIRAEFDFRHPETKKGFDETFSRHGREGFGEIFRFSPTKKEAEDV